MTTFLYATRMINVLVFVFKEKQRKNRQKLEKVLKTHTQIIGL